MNPVTQLRITALLAVAGLVGCQTHSTHAPSIAVPAPAPETAGAIRYQVDGRTSELHILAYRGGTMARLGHNHVISSKDVQGFVFLQQELSRSHVDLTLSVDSLIVDDPRSRSIEGEDFAADVPQDARDGTRRNLLRSEVLDVEHYPSIRLQSTHISGTRARLEVIMRIAIKSETRDVPVIVTLQENGDTLTATGEFAVRQTDFGITPFSIALGALQVQDQLRIKFSIVCHKQ
jgi:polyisoprenoid-binding protein YceI